MPTPEETMAFNNQEAYNNNINEHVDMAQQMFNMALRAHEQLGMKVKPGSKDAADRIADLQELRKFVSVKQPTAGYDPAAQLQYIDGEIARLSRPQHQSRRPIVQSATDNQRGR